MTDERPFVVRVGRRFARLATDAVVRRPALWRLFRGPIRLQFQRLASSWDTILSPGHLDAFEEGLAALGRAPRRVLDLGTGTGAGALAVAARFPGAEVVGVDLAGAMIDEARRKTAPDLAERVRFQVADAAQLPFPDGSFDLVTGSNMIPFFDELARAVAPGGHVLLSFSSGPETPIWVPRSRLEEELGRRGFSDFAEFRAGQGTALLARKT